jgi:hypothetical protein
LPVILKLYLIRVFRFSRLLSIKSMGWLWSKIFGPPEQKTKKVHPLLVVDRKSFVSII